MLSRFLSPSVQHLRIDALPPARAAFRSRECIVMGEGYAIALYAAPVPGRGRRRFVSYAKACRGHPGSYWEAQAFAKFASEAEHACPAAAMGDALDSALMSLANLGLIDLRSRAPRALSAPARRAVLLQAPAFAPA